MPYRLIAIKADERRWWEETGDWLGPLDAAVDLNKRLQTWRMKPLDPGIPFLVSWGRLVGGNFIGVHRAVAVFRSPQTGALHVSAMGGAAYRFMRTGVNGLVIIGKFNKPTLILIGSKAGKLSVEFQEVDLDRLWGYGGRTGIESAKQFLLDNYWDFIYEHKARPIVTGPGAASTIMGAIASYEVDYAKKAYKLGAEDFAARAGGGSALVRGHNVAAMLLGGDSEVGGPKMGDIDKIFIQKLGKTYIQVLNEKTIKYRFDPQLGTGGTFGVNYVHYRELIPMFNFQSIYLPLEERRKWSDAAIEHFWKPFQEEAFVKSRSWYNCGEPCPVVCKKVWRGKKIDYEPLNAVGPYIGVFTLGSAVKVADMVDNYGLDTIEVGYDLGLAFEAVDRGLIEPEEAGLSGRPVMNPLVYDVSSSELNASLAEEGVRSLMSGVGLLGRIGAIGLRRAAEEAGVVDYAVYVPLGDSNYMTPNYYWAPGMVAPIYMLGRYWTNYNPTFMDPVDFAKSVYSRALMELMIDEAGACRFHRGWLEPTLKEVYGLVGVDVDVDKFAAAVYREFADYAQKAGSTPRFWESKRTRDMVTTMASELGAKDWAGKDPLEWYEKFKTAFDGLVYGGPNR
ncbi:aldehyde ferredoxin oxidoreductase [Thermocladium modestius]|uniref:Aldehyde ferredoxin oxidoreductase n=1 Tax=Thermocladium modestius TaxID=62609 RepID=A0A830GTT6_9CREN|nr:aldehyde ferredoxin oxidoreductase N-terminal domain-containing protein [Thermocladium modestius]GGP19332.1 aldehyde ferredoxin oxidoreductase [Thermocladium modestius]